MLFNQGLSSDDGSAYVRLLKQKTVEENSEDEEVFNPDNDLVASNRESDSPSESSSDEENEDAHLVPISVQAAEFDGQILEVIEQATRMVFVNPVQLEERSVNLNQSLGALDLDETSEYDFSRPPQDGIPYHVSQCEPVRNLNIELGLNKF